MNVKNKIMIKKKIDEAAKDLVLPPLKRHPKGRNPHAHIALTIKRLCGSSYTELPDKMVPAVIEVIQYCKNNLF